MIFFYPKIDKTKHLSILKKLEHKENISSEEDIEEEDDEMIWKDNDAYQPICHDSSDEQSLTRRSLSSQGDNSPYATVPFLPKGHRHRVGDARGSGKYSTMPPAFKRTQSATAAAMSSTNRYHGRPTSGEGIVILRFEIIKCLNKPFPIRTQRCFNVYTTSITLGRPRINVLLSSSLYTHNVVSTSIQRPQRLDDVV